MATHEEAIESLEVAKGTSMPGTASYDPETGIYRWEVDYDQTIEEKVRVLDPSRIGFITSLVNDKKFPDERRGKRVVEGKIGFTNMRMDPEELPKKYGGILARPKELIDLARAFPRPALDESLPLVGAGQFWQDPTGRHYFLSLSSSRDLRLLGSAWLAPNEPWYECWRFLVLLASRS